MVFVELPIFVRCAESLFTDEDLHRVQMALLEDPLRGDPIPGGHGLRKLRAPLPGRGKRGGARVIYYLRINHERCYLVYAYAKNVAADLTPEQLRRLAEVMALELNDGRKTV